MPLVLNMPDSSKTNFKLSVNHWYVRPLMLCQRLRTPPHQLLSIPHTKNERNTHAHRASSAGDVVVVCTTGSPAAVTLKSISVDPFCHTGHAGFRSGTNLSFGSSERATDRNDCEKEVISSELLYFGGIALGRVVSQLVNGREGTERT